MFSGRSDQRTTAMHRRRQHKHRPGTHVALCQMCMSARHACARTHHTQASLNGYEVYCVVPTTSWAWRPAECAKYVTDICSSVDVLMDVIQAIRARCECGCVERMEGEVPAGQLIWHAHRTVDRLCAATRSCMWQLCQVRHVWVHPHGSATCAHSLWQQSKRR